MWFCCLFVCFAVKDVLKFNYADKSKHGPSELGFLKPVPWVPGEEASVSRDIVSLAKNIWYKYYVIRLRQHITQISWCSGVKVVHACNPNTHKAEPEVLIVQGQPGLFCNILPQNT